MDGCPVADEQAAGVGRPAGEAAGGSYREQVLDEAGHFAFTQLPQRFATLLREQLTYASQPGCRPGPWRA